MPQSPTQKAGKSHKMSRSGREKGRNASIRGRRVANTRRNHLRNAKRSCGPAFAADLEHYYTIIVGVPGKKCNRHLTPLQYYLRKQQAERTRKDNTNS